MPHEEIVTPPNPNNEFKRWELDVEFKLNHEEGICKMTIADSSGKVLKSMKFVQGMHFGEDNKLMNEEDTEAMKWLLRFLTDLK